MARNSLTQRAIGPVCTGSVSLDVSNMKDGDFAGLGLLQKNYGLVGVKINGQSKTIVMVNASTGVPIAVQNIPLNQQKVFLKPNVFLRIKKTSPISFTALMGRYGHPLVHN
jgi:hypothetical protein